jgi:uncharacterized membrane-anchored protein
MVWRRWTPIPRFELDARIAREMARQLEIRVWPCLHNIDDRISVAEQTLTELGAKVAAVDDALAQLDTATNEIAADLEALKQQVAQFDGATAAKIQAAADRLKALAADPENPVPETPDGGGATG